MYRLVVLKQLWNYVVPYPTVQYFYNSYINNQQILKLSKNIFSSTSIASTLLWFSPLFIHSSVVTNMCHSVINLSSYASLLYQ